MEQYLVKWAVVADNVLLLLEARIGEILLPLGCVSGFDGELEGIVG